MIPAVSLQQACQAGRGFKQQAQHRIVKAWLLDRKWGDTFVSIVEYIEHKKTFVERQKPLSYKQLLEKYTEDEISELLETHRSLASPGFPVNRHQDR